MGQQPGFFDVDERLRELDTSNNPAVQRCWDCGSAEPALW